MNALFGTTLNNQGQTQFNTQNQTNLNTQNQTQFNTTGQNNGQNNSQNNGQNTAQNNAQFANLQQCGNVRVYKLSPEGVQDLWPNVSCNGSLLSVQAGGRGHYIMYRFNGNNSAVNAPTALYPCNTQASLNANFGTQAGTQAQSGNVVCVNAQGGTGTLAGQGTTQGQNFNNQTNQTTQSNTQTQTNTQTQANATSATLQPVNNSGVTGSVNVSPTADGNTQISVSANGLQSGQSYVSLYYENSTCELEADSAEDMIGGTYTANSSGVGTTSGTADHPMDELHSVSVRSTDLNTLYACASF
jgi:hypothetical protein